MGKTNYIDSMIKQYGDQWIVALNPEDIQRSCKRLVKDMVRGNINYEKHGDYFLDAKFLDNLIIAVENELEMNSLHYNAMCFYQQYNPQIKNMSIHINHDYVITVIYNTIYNKLQQVKFTQNVGCLYDISALLNQYRAHLV
jgi:hypothetical protein